MASGIERFGELQHPCDGLTALTDFFLSALQELEAIKARVREMEEEAEKLKELQNEVEKQMNLSPPPGAFCVWMYVAGASCLSPGGQLSYPSFSYRIC